MKTKTPFEDREKGIDTHTLGVVSYLNALPLHAYLAQREDMILKPAVPSQLPHLLESGQCDVALLPIVDYWRRRDHLQRISDACIASGGETMTVRVFAKAPADKLSVLHVDGDSHTSVILAQIIWRELYNTQLELMPWHNSDKRDLDDVEALLLIGDKVVTDAPPGFGFEVDLGSAWKYLTGLPFVFAAWYGSAGRSFGDLASCLSEARDRGAADAERIAGQAAADHGWPQELAVKYLRDTLEFKITEKFHQGMEEFFRLSGIHELL